MISTAILGSAALCAAAAVWMRVAHRSDGTLWKLMGLVAIVLAIIFFVVTEPFEIRKVIAACVMPVGLVWLALFGASVSAARWAERRHAVLVWAIWLVFTASGNAFVGRTMVGFLEHKWTRVDPMASEPFDAILVLGGGVARHHHGQVFVGSSGDRVMLGARLYRAGLAECLVTSGPPYRVGQEPFPTMPELTAHIWRNLGVPDNAIVRIDGPRATKEEIAEFTRVVNAEGWERVAIVSSAVHLWRVERHCQRFGLEATLLPANFLSTRHPLRPRHLVPQSGGFRLVEAASWEIVGRLAGR